MSKRFVVALAALFAVNLVLGAKAQADVPLATFVYTGVGTLPSTGGQPQWQPYLRYSSLVDPPVGLLNDVTMSLIDVVQGSSYELTGDFAAAEALATNGASNPAWIGFHVPNSGLGSFAATTEPALIAGAFNVAPGVGPVDFAGFDLTRVRVISTSFQMLGGSTFDVTTEFTVYGDPIPEPGSSALAVCAVAALCGRRLRSFEKSS